MSASVSRERAFPPKFLAAMIAVRPLPGSPRYEGDNEKIMEEALSDLTHYQNANVDSVLLENDHDLPYIKPPLPQEGIDLMMKIAKEVRKRFTKPIGIQMLEAANITSLEIAAEADLDFIRAEGYVYAHIGGSGLIEGSAGHILRRRKDLHAEHIKVFADVKKKHCSHTITADLDITDEVKQADIFMADGIVVTGKFTGLSPDENDLRKAKSVTKLPIIVGSGMTRDNIAKLLPLADGFIVGSTFRKNGQFLEQLDPDRLKDFMAVFKETSRSYVK